MNSTKRYLPMLAVVCVLFLTAAVNAQNTTQEFPSNIPPFNSPCDGSSIQVQGPTRIDYHVNSTGDGPHIAVHMQMQVSTPDGLSNPYQANFEANGQFDSGTVCTDDPGTLCYDAPFHSVWIGSAAASNFKINGTVRVFLTNGTLNGAMIVGADPPVCTN